MDTRFLVFYEGSRCICPACGGLVYGNEEGKTCIDCKAKYTIVREGDAEKEMILEKK